MNIIYAARTDVGMKRKINEDSFCAVEEIGLFLVADGMGGHAAGEVASQAAVEVIKNSSIEALKRGALGRESFARAIKLANQAVYEMAQSGSGMKGMGTTVAGVLVDKKNSGFVTGNVGDSRIYRIRDNSIEQLSHDHSMVGLQLSMGLITKEEARRAAYKNVITRAIGTEANVEVDMMDEKASKGDVLLLCSDGLSSLVEDSDILDIVKRSADNLERAAEELVGIANFNGGDDNITAVLIKFI